MKIEEQIKLKKIHLKSNKKIWKFEIMGILIFFNHPFLHPYGF